MSNLVFTIVVVIGFAAGFWLGHAVAWREAARDLRATLKDQL